MKHYGVMEADLLRGIKIGNPDMTVARTSRTAPGR